MLPKDGEMYVEIKFLQKIFDGEEIKRYIQHEESHVKQAIEK